MATPHDKHDYGLLGEDAWLNDSAVTYRVREADGRWHVEMVFTNTDDPTQMLVRPIDHYPSRARAELFARNFQRQIRRDPRGTPKIHR